MSEDNEERPDRRSFLKMATMGAAALAAALSPESGHAAESKADGLATSSDPPSAEKVELLFLGTGAADWPRTYPPAEKKLERGQVRGMSSLLINGHVLIDCGPTVLDAMARYKVNPAGITDLLLTHTHKDHFHQDSILSIATLRDPNLGPLRFWAHPEALKRLPDSSRIQKLPVEIGSPFDVHGLGITGLEANHHVKGSEEECLHYLVESSKGKFLYATDGAWLRARTWQHLQGRALDALVWDATVGERVGDYRVFEHNDLTMIRYMNRVLKRRRVVKPDAKIVLTHMARKLHPPHAQLEKKLLPEGLIPAYDGMSIVLNPASE